MDATETCVRARQPDAPTLLQSHKSAAMLNAIKGGAPAADPSGDWRLAVEQAMPHDVAAHEPAAAEGAVPARACGGAHLRLARNAPLLQSQDILGALLREVNGLEDGLLTARSGAGTARSGRPSLARVTPLSRFAADRPLPDLPADSWNQLSWNQLLQQQLEESQREAASLREQLRDCQLQLQQERRASAQHTQRRRFGCFGS
ncbi:hypothetical protein ABPG75_005273 [Micractinium tetrahymenae]